MWSDWTEWACSSSSVSDRVRYHTCTNPKPVDGGLYCIGDEKATEICSTSVAPVCYNGMCMCEKTVGAKDFGDGTKQGSCATSKTCYTKGPTNANGCRGKF